jgi:hypothetical protein
MGPEHPRVVRRRGCSIPVLTRKHPDGDDTRWRPATPACIADVPPELNQPQYANYFDKFPLGTGDSKDIFVGRRCFIAKLLGVTVVVPDAGHLALQFACWSRADLDPSREWCVCVLLTRLPHRLCQLSLSALRSPLNPHPLIATRQTIVSATPRGYQSIHA